MQKLKELTRGKDVTMDSIKQFIKWLGLPDYAKLELLILTSHTYMGEGERLAKVVDDAVV